MVRLPEGYCIDSTEVTRAQYQAWLDTGPDPGIQDQQSCGWNTSLEPDAACLELPEVCQGSGCGAHPVVCVDWCDAYAYCQAVGKRLCGKIGGGPNGFGDCQDASLSQWYNACTSHGRNRYPYGNSYLRQACNGSNYEGADNMTVAGGTLERCQSTVEGYQGVYDLSGNVYEWQDACNGAGEAASCRQQGGSFFEAGYSAESYVACGSINSGSRSSVSPYVGFRCCSSP